MGGENEKRFCLVIKLWKGTEMGRDQGWDGTGTWTGPGTGIIYCLIIFAFVLLSTGKQNPRKCRVTTARSIYLFDQQFSRYPYYFLINFK